jgi:hypothetical protein
VQLNPLKLPCSLGPPGSRGSAVTGLITYKAKQTVTMHPRPLDDSNARSKLESCKEPSRRVAVAEVIYVPRPKRTTSNAIPPRRERRLASRGEEEEEGMGDNRCCCSFPTDITGLFASQYQPHTYSPPLTRSPVTNLLLDTLEGSVESNLTSKSKIASKKETKQNVESQVLRGTETKTALAQSQFLNQSTRGQYNISTESLYNRSRSSVLLCNLLHHHSLW